MKGCVYMYTFSYIHIHIWHTDIYIQTRKFTAVPLKTLENGVGYTHKLMLTLTAIDTNFQTS